METASGQRLLLPRLIKLHFILHRRAQRRFKIGPAGVAGGTSLRPIAQI